ncbi:hypothetical protein HDC34_003218 [Pseudoclavibacter sp. JAI123]|nr:hypothetical protein [Pseudoclavibacter sp. JAI123]NYF14883.1 hypothetical protein [Pseudoclavibacter sp. JAI123]
MAAVVGRLAVRDLPGPDAFPQLDLAAQLREVRGERVRTSLLLLGRCVLIPVLLGVRLLCDAALHASLVGPQLLDTVGDRDGVVVGFVGVGRDLRAAFGFLSVAAGLDAISQARPGAVVGAAVARLGAVPDPDGLPALGQAVVIALSAQLGCSGVGRFAAGLFVERCGAVVRAFRAGGVDLGRAAGGLVEFRRDPNPAASRAATVGRITWCFGRRLRLCGAVQR